MSLLSRSLHSIIHMYPFDYAEDYRHATMFMFKAVTIIIRVLYVLASQRATLSLPKAAEYCSISRDSTGVGNAVGVVYIT